MRRNEERLASFLYPDPAEFAVDRPSQNGVLAPSFTHGQADGLQTFPTQTWLPAGETQRGTLLRTNGDPQTPLLPSKPYVDPVRLTHEELRSSGVIPRIPVMPIGYADAEKIMSVMDGVEVPVPLLFRLDVHGRLVRSTIKNVVAKFVGEQEPDKWVLLTNHVDAWTKGAVDPSSGTAVMLELARVVSETSRQTGWRPRRSLVFCAFDAEEFGLIGSTEYVEEMLKTLQQRAVAVLNVDNINGHALG
ncbi:hypothetical protein M3Y99_00072500 [Aphelenchoides fujianensis]|nr:hypothetical protein M3Y99_00072500 [Aphelenchoides fujianensis]